MCCKAAWTIPGPSSRVRVGFSSTFSIYVDADAELLRTWYIDRFQIPQRRLLGSRLYFHHYAKLAESEATEIANNIWQDINYLNLQENILPTRERANLILTKGNRARHRADQAAQVTTVAVHT